MAKNLTSRHLHTPASNESSQSDNSYDNGKGKKKSNFTLVLLGSIVLLSIAAFVVQGHRYQRVVRVRQESSNSKNQISKENQPIHNKSIDNKSINNNLYEGWQPTIYTDQNHDECKSWRICFDKEKQKNCPGKCRNSLQDFGQAPPRPGFTPDPDLDEPENDLHAQVVPWVPDVTVLRRMLKAGVDHDGNPWPPPLVTETDRELCESIGEFGGPNDSHIQLLNAVPIRGLPLLSEWSDAAMTTKKMGRQPKILCMVYTMEQNHHTNIRAIRETWGPGCDGFLAFSTKDDPRIPAISLQHEGKEEYKNMVSKITI